MLFIGNGIGQLPFVMVRNKIREMKGIQVLIYIIKLIIISSIII